IRPEALAQALAELGPSVPPGKNPVAPGTDEEVFDRAAFLGRVMGKAALVRQVADLFRAEWPRSLQEMKAAVAAGDSVALAKAAHKLKGTLLNLGARGAVTAALRIEALA